MMNDWCKGWDRYVNKCAFLFNGIGTNPQKMIAVLRDGDKEKLRAYEAEAFSELNISERREERSAVTQKIADMITLSVCDRIVYEHFLESGITPDVGLAHSSGFPTICACFGAITYMDSYRMLDVNRAVLQSIAESGVTYGNGTIIGIDAATVQEWIDRAQLNDVVCIGSINSPIMLMVSGTEKGVAQLLAIADAEGALKTIPISSGVPYHSPLFAAHAEPMAVCYGGMAFTTPQYPILSECRRTLLTDGKALRRESIENPLAALRWDLCIKKLEEMGVTEFFDTSANGAIGKFTRLSKKKRCKIYRYEDV